MKAQERVETERLVEKCAFACEGTLRRHAEFPNFRPGEPLDVLCYSIVLG
jgi:RimJ/RimL family protein N-acetyltransferase